MIFDSNGDGKIDFAEFCAADRSFPMLLWPAFRIQESLRRETLGLSRFQALMEELHPDIYVADPEAILKVQLKLWERIRVYWFCFIPCLQLCLDPKFSFAQNCPVLANCCFCILPTNIVKDASQSSVSRSISIGTESENNIEVIKDDDEPFRYEVEDHMVSIGANLPNSIESPKHLQH